MTDVVAEPPKDKCVACDYEIQAGVPKCPKCGTDQTTVEFCRICKRRIPPRARFCHVCKSFQKFKHNIPMWSMTLSAGSAACLVISSLVAACTYVRSFHSDTKVMVTSAELKKLNLKVWNVGSKPSRLIAGRLLFPGNIEARLVLTDNDRSVKRNLIFPNQQVDVSLTTPTPMLELYKAGTDVLLPHAKAPNQKAKITLEVDVEESSDPFLCRRSHTRQAELSAEDITQFINGTWPK